MIGREKLEFILYGLLVRLGEVVNCGVDRDR